MSDQQTVHAVTGLSVMPSGYLSQMATRGSRFSQSIPTHQREQGWLGRFKYLFLSCCRNSRARRISSGDAMTGTTRAGSLAKVSAPEGALRAIKLFIVLTITREAEPLRCIALIHARSTLARASRTCCVVASHGEVVWRTCNCFSTDAFVVRDDASFTASMISHPTRYRSRSPHVVLFIHVAHHQRKATPIIGPLKSRLSSFFPDLKS